VLLNGFYRGRRRAVDPFAQHQGPQSARRLQTQRAKVFCISPAVDYFGIGTSLEGYKGIGVWRMRVPVRATRRSGGGRNLGRDGDARRAASDYDSRRFRAAGSVIGEEGTFTREFVKLRTGVPVLLAVYAVGQAAYNVLEYARTRKLQKTRQLVGSLPATRFALGEMHNRLEGLPHSSTASRAGMSEGRTYGSVR
jgi:hypothetical protein